MLNWKFHNGIRCAEMKNDTIYLMQEELKETIQREIAAKLLPVLASVESIQDAIERGIGSMGTSVQAIEEIKRKVNLTPEEVERVYGLNAATLANKRTKAVGPRYIKDGGKILYSQREIQKYLNEREILTNENN